MTRLSPFESSIKKTTANNGKDAVTAKNKLDSVDHCPVCDRLMRPVTSAGIPAFYCEEHRVCLPQKVS